MKLKDYAKEAVAAGALSAEAAQRLRVLGYTIVREQDLEALLFLARRSERATRGS